MASNNLIVDLKKFGLFLEERNLGNKPLFSFTKEEITDLIQVASRCVGQVPTLHYIEDLLEMTSLTITKIEVMTEKLMRLVPDDEDTPF